MSPDTNSPASPVSPETQPAPQLRTRPKWRKYWVLWFAFVCLFCGAGFLFSQMASAPKSGGKGKKGAGGATPVSVVTVQKGNIGEYINALGTVTPVYTVTLTSRVTGQLMEVRYREGQVVRKGDVLATIDARPYLASLVQAQGQMQRDQALLQNAKIDLNRYSAALQQHAVPEQTVATQQAAVNQDEGTVKVDQGNLDAAQVNVDYTKIVAPIDGRIGLRLVDPGNIVTANSTQGLLTITQLRPITVIFTMAEDYLSDVAPQLRAGHKLRVDALDRSQSSQIAQGTVLTVDNTIDTTTGTVKVRATFPNTDYRLFPNEFVNARLLVKMLNNQNLIPTAAIQRNNDVAYVYGVKPDKTVITRNIKVLTTDGETSAVTGVDSGETLVVDGFDRLQDGAKISVRQSNKPVPTSNDPDSASPGTEPAVPIHNNSSPKSGGDSGKQHRSSQGSAK